MNIEYEYARDMIVVIAVGTIVTAVVVALEVAVTVSYSVDALSDLTVALLIDALAGVTIGASSDIDNDTLMDVNANVFKGVMTVTVTMMSLHGLRC